MLFNSIEFAFFLPIVFLLYWFLTPAGENGPRYSLFHYWHVSEQTAQNIPNGFVLVASYIFYGWWDWRFLLLIAFTSLCSWCSGLLIKASQQVTQVSDTSMQVLGTNEPANAGGGVNPGTPFARI